MTQESKQGEGSYVYVLVHRQMPMVKIRRADAVLRRASAFNPRDIDFHRSFALRVSDRGAAVQLERAHETRALKR